MSIIKKLVKVVNEGDENGAKEVMHDDFKFLMHASGKTLSKDDVVKWVGMKDVKLEKERILFENEEVGFMHAIASFKDGNKEAVMSYYKFKDGKIVHQETGAKKLHKLRKILENLKKDLLRLNLILKITYGFLIVTFRKTQ